MRAVPSRKRPSWRPALRELLVFALFLAVSASASLPSRPCGGADNDILVEIIDHAGKRATLPHVWFRWEQVEGAS